MLEELSQQNDQLIDSVTSGPAIYPVQQLCCQLQLLQLVWVVRGLLLLLDVKGKMRAREGGVEGNSNGMNSTSSNNVDEEAFAGASTRSEAAAAAGSGKGKGVEAKRAGSSSKSSHSRQQQQQNEELLCLQTAAMQQEPVLAKLGGRVVQLLAGFMVDFVKGEEVDAADMTAYEMGAAAAAGAEGGTLVGAAAAGEDTGTLAGAAAVAD